MDSRFVSLGISWRINSEMRQQRERDRMPQQDSGEDF
jgi:hypothetical protein